MAGSSKAQALYIIGSLVSVARIADAFAWTEHRCQAASNSKREFPLKKNGNIPVKYGNRKFGREIAPPDPVPVSAELSYIFSCSRFCPKIWYMIV